MTKATLPKNQQLPAVIYFGSERETYLQLVQAADSKAFLQFIQQPLQVQLGVEKHKVNCPDRSRYTGLVLRERSVQGWARRAGEGANLSCTLLWLWSGVHSATQFYPALPPPRQ